jgi:hypothetical protein
VETCLIRREGLDLLICVKGLDLILYSLDPSVAAQLRRPQFSSRIPRLVGELQLVATSSDAYLCKAHNDRLRDTVPLLSVNASVDDIPA